MADIYLARQFGIGQFARHVAIKVLCADRSDDADSRAMFLDEARLVALLNHPNVATVLEVDVADGVHYLAMEYVHGVDLREVVLAAARAGRGVPHEVAASIIVQAAAGLDHAHRRVGPDGTPLALVHRDVSLSNIMCGYDGAVKVVDFGIAASAIASVKGSPGIVRGKAAYMSPEQCLGDEVDLRTDVFALGIVLYELTTGLRCFDGAGDFERMLAVVRGEYVLPTVIDPSYPADLEHVIRTALSIDATKRYASAGAMIDALERVARAHGWVLGASTIRHAMRGLFGEVSEPWSAEPDVEVLDVYTLAADRTVRQPMVGFAETDVADAPEVVIEVMPALTPATLPASPRRRLAAGSMHAIATTAVANDDDAMTGRRCQPLPRSRLAPLAA